MQTVLIKYLNEKLAVLRYVDKLYGLAAIVRDGDNTFPAHYIKNELQNINFDTSRNSIFFLPNGKTSRDTIDHPYLGCIDQINETYPFRLILYSKGNENINCVSASQNIAMGITSYLNGKQLQLESGIGLENANIKIGAVDFDKRAVWESLFSKPSELKDEDILIAIELEFDIQGVLACFVQQPCDFISFTYEASYTTLCQKIDECLALEVIKILVTDFTDSVYINAAKLANKVPDKDFILFSDEGSGTLLKVNDGYTYDSSGTITPIPAGPGNYRLVIYR